nr:hypothetical protein CFP56_23987 [Quercus suber]
MDGGVAMRPTTGIQYCTRRDLACSEIVELTGGRAKTAPRYGGSTTLTLAHALSTAAHAWDNHPHPTGRETHRGGCAVALAGESTGRLCGQITGPAHAKHDRPTWTTALRRRLAPRHSPHAGLQGFGPDAGTHQSRR